MDLKHLEIPWIASNNSKLKRILIFVLSIVPISFLMKYLSEWTHEFLGHIGFGVLVGGQPTSYYVSWIWPLEFGNASVIFPIGTSNIARALMASGGIITCLTVAIFSNLIIYFLLKKKEIRSIFIFVIFHFVFWYGFWAFMNSTGYLLMGSLLNFGDIKNIINYIQIPHWFFLVLGILALAFLYYFISINANVIFKPLLYITSKWILFLFWLLIPFIFILFSLNPSIELPSNLFILILILMFIPSLISLFISKKLFSDN